MTFTNRLSGAACATLLLIAALPAYAAGSGPLKLSPDHATASVADLDKESAWYERVLGLHAIMNLTTPDLKLRQMAFPGYRIDLVQRKGSVRHRLSKENTEQGWQHVVFKTSQIDKDLEILKAQKIDVQPVKDPKTGKLLRVMFYDPEGNELEIVTP